MRASFGFQCDFRLIAVVDDEQLDLGAPGSAEDSAVHFVREGAVLSLSCVSNPILAAPPDFGDQAIVLGLFDEPAVPECVEYRKHMLTAES